MSLLFFALFFPAFSLTVHAADGFDVDSVVTYKVEDSGKTLVTHDITLQNQYSTLYATTYTLTLENINAANVKAYDANGKPIQSDLVNDNQKFNVKVTFPDAVVGQGAKRHFKITYENSNFAVKTGEVWEISIPKLSDDKAFRN